MENDGKMRLEAKRKEKSKKIAKSK